MSCSEFHSKLDIFRFGKKYCDVNIVVQDRKFPCHRVVLAAASDYFDVMFGGGFAENNISDIALHDFEVETFQNVVKFIYVGLESEIKVCNFFNLLQASLFLGIRSLEECCVKFIWQNLSTLQDQIIDLYIFACSNNVKDLPDILSQYIVKDFNYFYKDQKFHTMSYDYLKYFLVAWVQDKLLLFKHENLLLDLLIRWVHHSPEERKKYFEQLVQIVDFERISMEYINFIAKYFKNSTEVIASIIEENTKASNSSLIHPFDIQDPSNTVLLKRKIVEYFTINEQCMRSSSNKKMPVPFVAPKFYKGELGLHVYVEYKKLFRSVGTCNQSSVHTPDVGYLKNAKIFSTNKYQPEWAFSGNTFPWYRYGILRCIESREPFDLMYCLEKVEVNSNNFKQSLSTYSSIDMSSVSDVLAQPPFRLSFDMSYVDMRAAQYGMVVYNPYCSRAKNRNVLHYYVSEVNTWFKLPQPPSEYWYPSLLAVEDNLVYLIGGHKRSLAQIVALDYRTSTWMELPSSNYTHCQLRKSYVLNGKIYVFKDCTLETFDPKALVWERLEMPKIPVKFLAAYENMLWMITDEDSLLPHNYKIAVYNPISQDWHVDHLSLNEAIVGYANELRDPYMVAVYADEFREPYMQAEYAFDYNIKDFIVFKS